MCIAQIHNTYNALTQVTRKFSTDSSIRVNLCPTGRASLISFCDYILLTLLRQFIF